MNLPPSRRRAFTLVELLVGVAIIGILAALITTAATKSVVGAKTSQAQGNLRQLAAANLAYVIDHGSYAPAQDKENLVRWHGARTSVGAPFDPSKGFLSPYMRDGHYLTLCPLLEGHENTPTFEEGAGGYGYNAAYIGGLQQLRNLEETRETYEIPEKPANVPRPAETIMFATTALARGNGIQEYPYTEPPASISFPGFPPSPLQASTHFRASGDRAIIAWCDGHVSMVEMNNHDSGREAYGGDSAAQRIGWFGPIEHNGYWNPQYRNLLSQ